MATIRLSGHTLPPAAARRPVVARRARTPESARPAVLLQHHGEMEGSGRGRARAPRRRQQRALLRDEEEPGTHSRADRLLRISYLVGIFKALNVLYSEKLADEWMRLPNSNVIFAGQTPLAYLIGGGQPAMQVVRRLLDARRAG